jgi:hypothetical protein
MSDALIVGDRMRISVALIRDLQEHEHTLTVRVKEIRDEEDGAKVLVLERYREHDDG